MADSQEASRIDIVGRDQHGREWHMVLEKETMSPTAVITPLFQAPWYPDQKYIRPGGVRNPSSLTIDYEAMERDWTAKLERWDRTLRRLAIKHYREKAADAIKDPPAELIDAVGPRPDRLEIVWAAMEGNRWVLGLSERKPAWAEEIFPEVEVRKARAARPAGRRFPDADEEGVQDEAGDANVAVGALAEGDDDADPSWADSVVPSKPTSGGRTKARRE